MVKLNPDSEFVKEFRQKIKDNDGYCPCRLKKTSDTKCMCKEFREQLERKEEGYCHCGLWYYGKE